MALQRTAGNRAVAAMLAAPRHGVMRGGTSSPALDGPIVNAPKVPEGDMITVCIEVFAASQSSKTQEGKRILDKLHELHGKQEIGFEDLSQVEGGVHGLAREGPAAERGLDIAVDIKDANDFSMTATTLVHEAVHHLYDESTLDEEIRSRNAEIDFYTEMQAGVMVGGILCQVPVGWDEEIETQREKRKLDQLIDSIMSFYYDKSSGFDAAWVDAHIDLWGGLPNRWAFTKSQYIIRLLPSARLYADLVLAILESEAGNATNFASIVEWVGGEEKLQDGLDPLARMPEFRQRLQAIQGVTGVELVPVGP
jgi:hypothetical protein